MDLGSRPIAPVTPQDNSSQNPAAASQGAPAGEDQFFGKMKFHVANGDTEGFADDHQVINDLRQVGYQPLGVSADGMTITMQGDSGPYEVKTNDALQKMGWQVKGYQPLDVDHNHVSPELRFVIESPGIKDDDHAKQAVITSRLQRMGIKEPQIVGSGSDWYVFNPSTSQYIALTNKPGLDLGDLGEVGARAGGFLGAGVGAVLGTPADLVSGPLGTAGGAAAGGFVGNRLTDAAAAAMEPSYLGALGARGVGENLKTVGGEVAGDAAAGLTGGLLGKYGGALGRGLLRGGVGSRIAQGLGTSAELGGKAVQGATDFLGKGTAREFGVAMADPTNATLYSEMAQLPRNALRGGARGIGSLGESDFARSTNPELAAKMRDMSAKLLTRRGPADQTLGSKFAQKISGSNPWKDGDIGAEEIMSNWGDMAGQKMGRMRAAATLEANPEIAQEARLSGDEQGFMNDWHESLARDHAPDTSSFGSLGRGMDNAAKLGEMGVKAAGIPYDIGMGTARLGGRALRYGGRALRSAGEGLAPVETPAVLHGASEELMNRMKRRQSALQQQGYARNILPDTLAKN